MINVSSLLEELKISQKEFENVYKEVTGKAFSKGKDQISDKDSNAIKKQIKEASKASSSQSSVMKGKEIGGSLGGFFLGLGFEKPTEEKKEEPKKEEADDELIIHAATKSTKKIESVVPMGNGENAKVIRRAEPKPYQGSRNQPRGSRPQFHKARPSSNRSTTRPTHNAGKKSRNSKPTGNFRGNVPTTKKAKPTPQRALKQVKEATTSSTLTKKTEIVLSNTVSIKEFSEKMGVSLQDVLKVMMQNGIIGGINTALDHDTASLIAEEFNVKVKAEEKEVSVEKILTGDLQAILDIDKDSEHLEERPPVVTVMGHVDHGKTSLLDYLRKSDVTGGEAGGITQSIGASSVTHNNKKITFIDTPGHELFTALRARGAKLTNIAIIIIAADDGIKPQTVESINHAKEAGVPIIVAVTKIDKPDHQFEKIKSDVGNYGLIPEEWGGDVPIIGVSSKTGEGIPELLDHILLQSEVLELKYNPKRKAVGVVVDAQKDPRQGITTSLIVLTGTLQVGDVIVVHNMYGKVKRMLDYKGKPLKKAIGGDPVMILGLSEVPEPGRVVESVKNEKEAKERVSALQDQMDNENAQSTVQHFLQKMQNEDHAVLKLILKSDGPSSLEALKHAVNGIQLPRSVDIKQVHTDIGEVTDSDISLAQAADAIIIGFNIKEKSAMKKKADQLKVTIKSFDIIYELVDYIEQLVKGLIEVELKEVAIGKLDLLAMFFRKEKTMVIGGKVNEGKIVNGAFFRVMRDGEEYAKGTVTSLQKEQESVKEITVGHECGMKVTCKKKLEEGDVLEFYIMEEEQII